MTALISLRRNAIRVERWEHALSAITQSARPRGADHGRGLGRRRRPATPEFPVGRRWVRWVCTTVPAAPGRVTAFSRPSPRAIRRQVRPGAPFGDPDEQQRKPAQQDWRIPALSGLLSPSPTPPGSGYLQLRCPAATGTAKVSHLHSSCQRLTVHVDQTCASSNARNRSGASPCWRGSSWTTLLSRLRVGLRDHGQGRRGFTRLRRAASHPFEERRPLRKAHQGCRHPSSAAQR